ncbi:MAG: hydrogen gas-evolving membrane-bound hydrogenase subunit E [Granulosicoccus sp.]
MSAETKLQTTSSSDSGKANGPSSSAKTAFGCALASAILFFVAFASQISSVSSGTPWIFSAPWIPRLGVDFTLHIDGLSLLFGLLISGIGVFVVIYSFSYFKTHKSHARLQWLLLAFMLAMLGLVSSDNIILLFVFWELTTITSFLLVGFDHENSKARRSALQALLITGGGGLALLVGLIMLGQASDTYLISEIIAAGPAAITGHSQYPLILTLILIGAFTKSAQFPFHFWLPNAMAAPSPVSAYLHSATMVKAGIYLMMRLQPSLGGTDAWFYTLTIAGAITAVWSSLMALRQTDMKLMLAWTTVMALGTLTMFLASDLRIAALAAVTFLLVHAFYKCALFLIVGNIDKSTGTRDFHKLGSLVRTMPVSAIIASLAALSMAGFPPFLGFIGKELKYEGALAIADEPWLIVIAAVSANAMMVAIALTFVFRVFLGGQSTITRTPKEVSVLMWIGPLFLAIAGLATGIFPELIAKTLIQPAVSNILASPAEVKLSLWHGINIPLILSIVTVALGALMFFKLTAVSKAINSVVEKLPVAGDSVYETLLNGAQSIASTITNRLQTGSLSHYLTIVFSAFVIAVAATLMYQSVELNLENVTPVTPLVALVIFLMTSASIVVAFSKSRLLSICGLGIVGSGVAVLFLIFGAIDVAITQLMVETLFVVLIATVLVKLPRFPGQQHPGKAGGFRDASIAIAAGVVMTIITLGVSLAPLDLTVTQFFEENSLAKAYGRNIVNVILVDFRALDTLGEVAVVATAAMAVIGLLKVRAHPQGPES